MKLLRLHVHGFKSFKDKTTIHFDEGITGIVGPNGCGKSNIVDALFWVMGEQSAKHLRGNKMKDLIFAGSSKYSPGAWAEVTLVLQNTRGKHIHIGQQVHKPNEIALTRKLYRNGETEYRINGMPARLKDIHEVFMDTGAGAKSYSIIAQGEINRLVQAKPQERRTMIEEVAGITKFKMRKRESLKKMENTQSNLNRLSDLQSEIYKNLKALERQAEKAEKARSLKAKIQRHDLIVSSHKEFDHLTSFVNGFQFIKTKSEEIEQLELRKNQLELSLEDEKIKKIDLMEKIDGLQAQFNEEAKELAASEERLKHLKSSRDEKEKRIEEKNTENEEIIKDIEARSARLEELKVKLTELEEQNLAEMDFSDREELVESLKEQQGDINTTVQDLAAEIDALKESTNELDQQIYRNTSKMEEYSASLQDINEEVEELEKATAGRSDELVKLREDTQAAKEKLHALEETTEKLKAELDEKSPILEEKEKEFAELSKDLIKIDSKRQSLIEINKSGEGVKAGAKAFIDENESAHFEILGHVIESVEGHEKALEALFSQHLDSLITNEQDLDKLVDWNRENGNKSFDVFLTETDLEQMSEETLERLKLKGTGELTRVSDIISINNGEYKEQLLRFFDGFLIAENLDLAVAQKVAKGLSFKGLVSRDGNISLIKTANGTKIAIRSEEDRTQGVVERNNLIKELTVSLEEKTAYSESLEAELIDLRDLVMTLKKDFEISSRELHESETAYVSLKSSLTSKEEDSSGTTKRMEILLNRKSEISKSRLELIEGEEELANKHEGSAEKLEALAEQLESEKLRLEDVNQKYEDERSELIELQASAKTYHQQIEGYTSQIDDVKVQVERYEEKRAGNITFLENLEAEIETAEATVLELEESNQSTAENLSEKESYLNLVKDELTQLLSGMQERETELKTATARLNKLDKEISEIQIKAEQTIQDEEILVRNIFEKYRVDLRSTVGKYLEYTTEQLEGLQDISSMFVMETEDGETSIEAVEYVFDKKYPAFVRESREKYKRYRTDLNRLGEINWQAVEDYDRQKLRYDFLKQQEEELKTSLTDLEMAINHIDEKSKQRFKEAYEAVTERFTKVFPIIFGGGEAKLEIVGDLNDPECGIEIIAKPPGKKMQSINLMSGGEKAMTAVSLIFSIFLVKPSPFCLLDEVDAPLDDANVGRFNELLREMSEESQFILITHNKKTMELNDTLYGVTMQEPGVSKAVSVQLH
jgi:chromosome segregation protein